METFDIPVLLIVFNRPEITARNVANLKTIRPARLFIAADGPRPDNAKDKVLCKATRRICSYIDWPCEVKTLFHEQNKGCRMAVEAALTWFFEHVAAGIILEDDCIATQSFFTFCSEMLERYHDDPQIISIVGSNFQQRQQRGDASYYFSRYTGSWGWASWRRAWNLYDQNLKLWNQVPDIERQNYFFTAEEQMHWQDALQRIQAEKLSSWAYIWAWTALYYKMLSITPQHPLVNNIGFFQEGTHTVNGVNPIKYTDELEWPLRHPKNIQADFEADIFVQRNFYTAPPARDEHLYIKLNEFCEIYAHNISDFTRVEFYNFNKKLYLLSLKAMGILDSKNEVEACEDYFIKSIFKQKSNLLTIEVGGNKGNYSARIRKYSPDSKVIVFEPNPTAYAKLKEVADWDGFEVINVGLSDKKSELSLYYDSNGHEHGDALFCKNLFNDQCQRSTKEYKVKFITLDEFINHRHIKKIDLLKIDNSGHELNVLHGAKNILDKNRIDIIHIVLHDVNAIAKVFAKDLYGFLPNFNFFRILPNGLVELPYESSLCEVSAIQSIVAIRKGSAWVNA